MPTLLEELNYWKAQYVEADKRDVLNEGHPLVAALNHELIDHHQPTRSHTRLVLLMLAFGPWTQFHMVYMGMHHLKITYAALTLSWLTTWLAGFGWGYSQEITILLFVIALMGMVVCNFFALTQAWHECSNRDQTRFTLAMQKGIHKHHEFRL